MKEGSNNNNNNNNNNSSSSNNNSVECQINQTLSDLQYLTNILTSHIYKLHVLLNNLFEQRIIWTCHQRWINPWLFNKKIFSTSTSKRINTVLSPIFMCDCNIFLILFVIRTVQLHLHMNCHTTIRVSASTAGHLIEQHLLFNNLQDQ